MIIENKPMVRVEKPNEDLAQHEMIGKLMVSACHKLNSREIQTLYGVRVIGIFFSFFKFWYPNAYIDNILFDKKVEHNRIVEKFLKIDFRNGLGFDFRVPAQRKIMRFCFA